MKNLILTSIVISFLGMLNETNAQSKTDTVGVYMNMQDEKFYMTGNVEMTVETVSYGTGKKKKIEKQKFIKWMTVYNRVFLNLPIDGVSNRLMEVLAMNENHFLAQYWQDSYYLYVFDYKGEPKLRKVNVITRSGTGGIGEKNNKKAFDEIRPYFGDCPELLDALQDNLKGKRGLTNEIVNLQCEGAPALSEVVKVLQEKLWAERKR